MTGVSKAFMSFRMTLPEACRGEIRFRDTQTAMQIESILQSPPAVRYQWQAIEVLSTDVL